MATILDKQVRKFLDTSGLYDSPDKFLGTNDREDPTYLGFTVEFVFSDEHGESHSHNGVPHGLLLPEGNENSTIDYFKGIGLEDESLQISGMIDLLREVQTKSPHFFQSITGLADAYRIDPNSYGRGMDASGEFKKLEITTLESLDMRMTLLADLYRKAMFDSKTMTWKTPENMREFNMNIYVAEIRSFHATTQEYVKAVGGRPRQDIPPSAGSPQNVKLSDYSPIAKKFNDTVEQVRDTIDDIKIDANEVQFKALDSWNNNISILEFKFTGCEFEFFGEFALPFLEEISNADVGDPISMTLPITYRDVVEVNEYKIFDWLLKDNKSNVTVVNGEQKIELIHPQGENRGNHESKKNKELQDIQQQNLNNLGPLDRALIDKGFNPDGLVGQAADKAKAELLTRTQNLENRALLGNAYGFQPDAQVLLNQAARFIRGTVDPGDLVDPSQLGNIGLTGSGPRSDINIDIDGGETKSTDPKQGNLGQGFESGLSNSTDPDADLGNAF